MKNSCLYIILLGLILGATATSAHVEARLIAEADAAVPGQSFRVAIHLKMDPHWHTYWENPGDLAGLATQVEWILPGGVHAGELAWPVPQRFETGDLVNYGYEGETVLLTTITTPADAASPLKIIARLSWLACKADGLCVPGDAEVSLVVPIAAGRSVPGEGWLGSVVPLLSRMPRSADDWTLRAEAGPDAYLLTMVPPEGAVAADPTSVAFYPLKREVVDTERAPTLVVADGVYRIRIPRYATPEEDVTRLAGVIVADRTWRDSDTSTAMTIDVALTEPVGTDASPVARPVAGVQLGVVKSIFFAFLGGLILNLMPCVFPVISLKILGFVNQAGAEPRKIWWHGVTFAAGVVISFWVLAALLLMIKTAVPSTGWGFQLKSPAFVVCMAYLFFLLGLSLFGVFELGTTLTTAGAGAQSKQGLAGSFMSGVLATLVATPCSGPFMAPAIGFALTQPVTTVFLTFSALGLGMAAPYLVLSRFPGWLNALPRPGRWMESLKQFMGFLLIAFTLFLVWVYAALRGADGLSRLLTGLLLVGFGAWIFGRWGNISSARGTRFLATLAAVGLVALAVGTAIRRPPPSAWTPYSAALVEELRREGTPVFVDFTAKWCGTCISNKKFVLNTRKVQEAFRRAGVRLIIADWTNHEPEISSALEAFGRRSVPLYVLYSGDADKAPTLLPELLTPGIVLNALEDLP
jgi:thiol:disulfide interchange protein/DsbC/DsbD-like thiol-disulfide interchange protein